ncbi:MAG: SRPBCC family protein [Planctomycetes bacterium]|nr:SRPBCC family protein [Planctomycetota bacterium]
MRVFTVREAMWANAAAPRVWQRVAEVERWPEWNPGLAAAKWRGKRGLAKGNRFRLHHRRKARPFLSGGRVDHVDPESALVWSDAFLLLRVEFSLEFRSHGRGTEVEFTSQFSGIGARWVPTDSFVRWLTRFQREFLVGLRQSCESVSGDRWSEE